MEQAKKKPQSNNQNAKRISWGKNKQLEISQIYAYESSESGTSFMLAIHLQVKVYMSSEFDVGHSHGRILTKRFLNLLTGRLALINLLGLALTLASRCNYKHKNINAQQTGSIVTDTVNLKCRDKIFSIYLLTKINNEWIVGIPSSQTIN